MEIVLNDFGLEWKRKDGIVHKADYDDLIKSYEKQIPKKPYIQQNDRNNDCMECPSCDSFLGYATECKEEYYQCNYCPNCGQRIDFGKEE